MPRLFGRARAAALAFVALCLSMSVFAQANAAPQATGDQMTALAGWAQTYREVSQQTAQNLGKVMRGANEFQSYLHRNDAQAAAAWAGPWVAEMRTAIAANKVSVTALSNPPVLAVSGDSSRMKAISAGFQRLAPELKTNLIEDDTLQAELVDAIEKAAGGDQAAAANLALRMADGVIQSARGERAMLEVDAAISGPDHPQAQVARAMIGAEDGLLALFKLRRDAIAGGPVAPDACIEAMKQAADAIDAAARQIDADTTRSLAEINSPKGAKDAFQVRLARGFATYRQSSAKAVALAGALRSTADTLAAGHSFGSQELVAALTLVTSTVRELQAIDQQRADIIAGKT